MKLGKQVKLLSWGTPIKVFAGKQVLYDGFAKNLFDSDCANAILDKSIKTIGLDLENSPVVRIVINDGGLRHEG